MNKKYRTLVKKYPFVNFCKKLYRIGFFVAASVDLTFLTFFPLDVELKILSSSDPPSGTSSERGQLLNVCPDLLHDLTIVHTIDIKQK